MRIGYFYSLIFAVILGLSALDVISAVSCISSGERSPANPTYLRIRQRDKWRPGISKKQWGLPRDMAMIAMYSTAHADKPSLTVQPVSPPEGFRKVKITLIDSTNGYEGGEYTLAIPDGENNCVAELQEKGMDISSVAVW